MIYNSFFKQTVENHPQDSVKDIIFGEQQT